MNFRLKNGMIIPICIIFAVFCLSLLFHIAGYIIAGKARSTNIFNKGLVTAAISGASMVISVGVMYSLVLFT